MKSKIFIFFFVFFLLAAFEANALQKAKPISTDNRIRTYIYNPNEVYVMVGHFRFQSSIEFEKEEKITAVSVGDATGWQITPQINRIFLKPIDKEATTNMTVITDKRTYFFELYGEEASDIRDEDMIFTVRFVYTTGSSENVKVFQPEFSVEEANAALKPDLSKPENYNFNYTLAGSEYLSPIKVFDDGEFTFFQFRDKNTVLPGFFEVDGEGKEALVNYRMVGDYVVVERVTSQFTLRNGTDIVCVFNESRPLEKKVEPELGPIAPKKRK